MDRSTITGPVVGDTHVPQFDTHIRYGKRWASCVAVLTLLPIYLYTGSLPVSAFFSTVSFLGVLIGAVLPDIDSHSSIPRRSLERLVATILVAVIAFTVSTFWGDIQMHIGRLDRSTPSQVPVIELSLLLGLFGIIVLFRAVPALIHWVIPPHRGFLHTLTPWLIVGLGIAVLSFLGIGSLVGDRLFATLASLTIGGSLLVGIGVHLWLDGELAILQMSSFTGEE